MLVKVNEDGWGRLTAQGEKGAKGKRVISGLWRVAGWARAAKWVRKKWVQNALKCTGIAPE